MIVIIADYWKTIWKKLFEATKYCFLFLVKIESQKTENKYLAPKYIKQIRTRKLVIASNKEIIVFGALKGICRVHEVSQSPIMRASNALSYIQKISSKKSFNCQFPSEVFGFRELQHFIFTWCESERRLQFTLRMGRFDIIVLFVGGNDLFNGKLPSKDSTEEFADKISDLANVLKDRANEVFVKGIPHRYNQRERTSAVNKLLFNRKEDRGFRGLEERIYKVTQMKEDEVHINQESIGFFYTQIENTWKFFQR